MNINYTAKSIGYPKDITSNDNAQYADLVYWLETSVLKKKNSSEREFLRDGIAKDWPEHLHKYAVGLNCPKSVSNIEGQVDFILNCATKVKYLEKEDVYNKYSIGNLKTSNVPNVEVDNILDHVDYTSKDFQIGINKMAKLLNIPQHPDPKVVLRACATVTSNRLHKNALEKPENYIVAGMPFPYKEADPGFTISNEAVMEAAKVLRLLYISDLRALQTKVNECIVAVQSVTANPKTDTKLGQVGK